MLGRTSAEADPLRTFGAKSELLVTLDTSNNATYVIVEIGKTILSILFGVIFSAYVIISDMHKLHTPSTSIFIDCIHWLWIHFAYSDNTDHHAASMTERESVSQSCCLHYTLHSFAIYLLLWLTFLVYQHLLAAGCAKWLYVGTISRSRSNQNILHNQIAYLYNYIQAIITHHYFLLFP